MPLLKSLFFLPRFLYAPKPSSLLISRSISSLAVASPPPLKPRRASCGTPFRPHSWHGDLACSLGAKRPLACALSSGPVTPKRVRVAVSSAQGEVGIGGSSGEEKDRDLKPEVLLTLPTILTIGRVAAVPLIVSTFYMSGSWATKATTSIFIAAAFTDWLDGYIARKMRLKSSFGAFLDPVADKLMVAATLVLLCTRPLEVSMFGEVPWLLTIPSIAIIGREITMSALREWAASQNPAVLEAVAVNNLGKWKTATQMISLTILLATRDSSLTGTEVAVASGVSLLYASAGLAIWSLVVYTRNIWRVLSK